MTKPSTLTADERLDQLIEQRKARFFEQPRNVTIALGPIQECPYCHCDLAREFHGADCPTYAKAMEAEEGNPDA